MGASRASAGSLPWSLPIILRKQPLRLPSGGAGRQPLSHRAAASAVATAGAPAGGGGRRRSSTGRPASRAAASLGAGPPLSLVTSTSTRCSRSSARSPSRVKGPRSRTRAYAAGSGGAGAVDRADQEAQGQRGELREDAAAGGEEGPPPESRQQLRGLARAVRPCPPVPRRGSIPACGPRAAVRPRAAGRLGRVPADARRRTGGWRRPRRPSGGPAATVRARPSPPNPPTLACPVPARGSGVRPAKDVVTSKRVSPASSTPSARASADPPSTSTRRRISRLPARRAGPAHRGRACGAGRCP